jgi:lycopene beta-cyclase
VNSSGSEWDIVIAGAGLAGLSLAAELAAPEFSHLRILLIEPRNSYERDRTWSFWATPNALPARWRLLEATRWNQWRVSHLDRNITASCEYAYASIRADVFYESALTAIASVSNITWLKEQAVKQTVTEQDGVSIITSAGQSLKCQWLFDSRPPQASKSKVWVQHFTGWEVESSKVCFDSSCVDLMAFGPSDDGLHFIYCLPYSTTRALVESTWISSHYDPVDAQAKRVAELKDALAKRWHCPDYSINFEEQGALPLLPSLPADQSRQTRIGRAGGALRAATGYAFCNTLQHTASLANSLREHFKQGKPLQTWQASPAEAQVMDRWMDRALFRVLENDWQAAPGYFLDMFERVPAGPLIRFLQGGSKLQDRLTVMRALPTLPFLQAALKASV